MSERSLTRMNTSDQDVTPELDQTEEEDDEDEGTLNEILQKISERKNVVEELLGRNFVSFSSVCFAPKERGVRHLRQWLIKSDPKAREQFQSTTIESTFMRTTIDESVGPLDESVQIVEDRLASRVSIVFSAEFLQEFPSAAQLYFNEGSTW